MKAFILSTMAILSVAYLIGMIGKTIQCNRDGGYMVHGVFHFVCVREGCAN